MLSRKYDYKNFPLWLSMLAICLTFFASCASSSTSSTNSSGGAASMPAQLDKNAAPGQAQSVSSAGQSQSTTIPKAVTTDQYLVKTLKVSMQVKDTRKVANAIQNWISLTDTRSISAGTDYEPAGDNVYTVNLTFSVQSSAYPRIYTYLRDYSSQNGGQLSSFTETVQNVTGNYVDTQSRLKTLHAEQARLLDLMSHAQAMGDIVTIEQRLTDVEGQIETYEGQLKNLADQISFYTVQINLNPISAVAPPPTEPGWSIVTVFQQAFSASIMFAQVLLTFLVWLLAFAWYIVPVIIIVWLVRRFKFHLSKMAPMMVNTQKTGVK